MGTLKPYSIGNGVAAGNPKDTSILVLASVFSCLPQYSRACLSNLTSLACSTLSSALDTCDLELNYIQQFQLSLVERPIVLTGLLRPKFYGRAAISHRLEAWKNEFEPFGRWSS